MEKRSKIIFKIFALACLVLTFVMLKIVTFDKQKFAYAASKQHLIPTTVKIYRGIIYDRNFIPFVDCRSYILKKDDGNGKNVRYNITKRYDKRSLARHLIGYTDAENNGASGLEKRFDSYLSGDGSYVFSSIGDVNSKSIKSLPETVKNDGEMQKGIRLTLDYHVQKAVENALDRCGENGAAVVLDAKNFDVLATASRPDFDQNNVESYLNGGGTELINRAAAEYDAGSIFKIVTAAAALENGIAGEKSVCFCGGGENIDGIDFACNKKDGHGEIDFYTGFAKSCNVYFYNLAISTGAEKLCDMAKKFGIGDIVCGIDGEKRGSRAVGTTNCDLANSAIGQGKIMITPIQAARMAAIIANGGVVKNVNIVQGKAFDNAGDGGEFYYESEKRVISRETAEKLKDMMYLAVSEGTGKSAYDAKMKICGKTGSAQTGWEKDGTLMVHGWFVGFFPYDNPKYAMAVFLENGQSGAEAAKVFLDAAKEINEINGK